MNKYHGIVLSAGMGSRLLPLTLTRPKPLMRLDDNRTILNHLIEGISSSECVSALTLVCGHKFNSIKHAAREHQSKPVNCALNPFYSMSGPLGSIWIALSAIESDHLIIANGDTVLYPGFTTYLDSVLARSDPGYYLLCSRGTRAQVDSVNALVRTDGALIAVGKEIQSTDDTFESSGVFVISGCESRAIVENVLHELFVSSTEPILKWPWHSLLNVLIADGHRVEAVSIPSTTWKEIDSAEDLAHLHNQSVRGTFISS